MAEPILSCDSVRIDAARRTALSILLVYFDSFGAMATADLLETARFRVVLAMTARAPVPEHRDFTHALAKALLAARGADRLSVVVDQISRAFARERQVQLIIGSEA